MSPKREEPEEMSTPPAPDSALRQHQLLATLALFCFALVIFLAKATESSLPATDGATHADLAMDATAHGWLPRLPLSSEQFGGHWGKSGYNDHPFLFFYLSGWILRAFGPDAWSAKLLPCLFSVGCVMLVYLLGRALRSSALGISAGIILALTRPFIVDGLNSHLDGVMSFFILLSFLLWEKDRPVLAGVAAGMGVWFKTPVALLLYPAAFITHLIRFDILKKIRPLLGSLLAALTVASLIWILTGVLGGWDLVQDYWVRQLWGTAVGGRGGVQAFDPLAFLTILRSQYMPWSVLLVLGVAWNLLFIRVHKRDFLVPLFASAVLVAAISVIRFKYDHYFTPAYPFLALLAAQPLAFWVERHEQGFYRFFSAFTMLGATVLLVTPIQPSPESFPHLRKFLSYMQSRGSCHDQVLMVEGGQPYGNYLDYANLIHFYAARRTAIADCQTVNLLSQAKDVKWILIFGKNYPACLDDSLKGAFSKVVQDGDQFLLARPEMISGDGSKIDLTPLDRDLKAAVDCKAAPLPADRYHSYGG